MSPPLLLRFGSRCQRNDGLGEGSTICVRKIETPGSDTTFMLSYQRENCDGLESN
jgi:hypothetical protein